MANNKEYHCIIDTVDKKLVDVEASMLTGRATNMIRTIPRNWTAQELFNYAEEQVLKFARLTEWRDNPKAGPPFRGYEGIPLSDGRKREVDRIHSCPEEFLQSSVRYKTQTLSDLR